jgi:hypothetical protein
VGSVDALMPAGALLHERLAQPHLDQMGAAPGAHDLLGGEHQPAVPSKVKSACWPANRASQARSSTRLAGWIRP